MLWVILVLLVSTLYSVFVSIFICFCCLFICLFKANCSLLLFISFISGSALFARFSSSSAVTSTALFRFFGQELSQDFLAPFSTDFSDRLEESVRRRLRWFSSHLISSRVFSFFSTKRLAVGGRTIFSDSENNASKLSFRWEIWNNLRLEACSKKAEAIAKIKLKTKSSKKD